jgi:hypothetical protein
MFCFSGNLDVFYKGLRWTNWKGEISQLDGTKVFNFSPYLWTKQGKEINKDSRMIIPVEELYIFKMEAIRQLGK